MGLGRARLACMLLLDGPAAVTLDGLVYLPHQADGFFERDDETLVAGDVLLGKRAAGDALFAAPVVEPLVADLVR